VTVFASPVPSVNNVELREIINEQAREPTCNPKCN